MSPRHKCPSHSRGQFVAGDHGSSRLATAVSPLPRAGSRPAYSSDGPESAEYIAAAAEKLFSQALTLILIQ